MKKKSKQKQKDFDQQFDDGESVVDFGKAVQTEGLSKVVKLPPIGIPAWLAVEIDALSKLQANSKAAIVRQLLVEAVRNRKRSA